MDPTGEITVGLLSRLGQRYKKMEKIEYSDGKDYSGLEANLEKFPELFEDGCVNCGSQNVTVLDDKDICHECGYVYT